MFLCLNFFISVDQKEKRFKLFVVLPPGIWGASYVCQLEITHQFPKVLKNHSQGKPFPMLHIYSGSNVGGGEAASETKYAGTANGAQNFQISPFFLSRQNSCPILTQPQQNDLDQEQRPNRSGKLFEPVSFFSNAGLSHLFKFIQVKTVGRLWQKSRVRM